jgi:anti-sigma factor ChrR (cupin superfamily)
MGEELGHHPDDRQIEEYALGILPAEAIPEFEQHLLICHDCQDRVAEMDAEVQGMQAAARELRAQELMKRGKAGGGLP